MQQIINQIISQLDEISIAKAKREVSKEYFVLKFWDLRKTLEAEIKQIESPIWPKTLNSWEISLVLMWGVFCNLKNINFDIDKVVESVRIFTHLENSTLLENNGHPN